MELSEIIGVVLTGLEDVEEELESNIKSEIPLVYDVCKYILGSGGKRIRPCVLLLVSAACGDNAAKERIMSAAAIELIHTATLLHDDVVDDATLRRGKTSSNITWGNKPSVLVGDFMLAKALNLINSCGDIVLIDSVTRAAAKLAEGQVLEVMSAASLTELNEGTYFDIIEHKTASLMESCGEVGAIIAGSSEETVSSLGAYGRNVGIAFQITDDALDYSAKVEDFGKALGQDLMEGKLTLPLIYSLTAASEDERRRVFAILESEEISESNIDFVFRIVNGYQGVDMALSKAVEFADNAKTVIADLPNNEFKLSLLHLADYIKERKM